MHLPVNYFIFIVLIVIFFFLMGLRKGSSMRCNANKALQEIAPKRSAIEETEVG